MEVNRIRTSEILPHPRVGVVIKSAPSSSVKEEGKKAESANDVDDLVFYRDPDQRKYVRRTAVKRPANWVPYSWLNQLKVKEEK